MIPSTKHILKTFYTAQSSQYLSNDSRVLFRTKSYYRHRYCPEVETAVNRQIQAEQDAAHTYLIMAAGFLHPSISRPGAGGFFMRMYHEELQHMENIIHYQLQRGGIPSIKQLTPPTLNLKITLIDAFKQALDMEHSVTELIEQLICTAENAKDHHCVNFLTSVFMEEQINSINKLAHHVTEIARIGDSEDGLWNYDLNLAKNHPYKNKDLKK